jgi:hypothetical protein
MRPTSSRPLARLLLVALLLVASAAMVAQLGSVPHSHAASAAGFYNAEHDLTLLAALAGHGLAPDATPAPALEPVSVAMPPLVAERPSTAPAYCGDSRAPPSA